MYKIQENADEKAVLSNDSVVIPLMTLKDEYGGISHIINDDHCYVLINKSGDGRFSMSRHWYREAVRALKRLPLPK